MYNRVNLSAASLLVLLGGANSWAAEIPTDFSGVWAMVQHSRPGAPFFIPVEPEMSPAGKAITQAFAAKYDVVTLEATGPASNPVCRP